MRLFVALFLVCTNAVSGVSVSTYIPENAKTYLPTLKAEQIKFWRDHPHPEQLGALIEHESCISLTHSRCWAPTSRLKTSREEGAGVGQITRAYRPDGSIRFDALTELKTKHESLSELSWGNVYSRPDLQLRAVVLKSQDNYKYLSMVQSPDERLKFADAAYNGGMGGVQNERRACGLKKDCDPQKWFGNVELTCMKSKAALYGNRSACDINRHHVKDVIVTRSPKYVQYLPIQKKKIEVVIPRIKFEPRVSILNSILNYIKEVIR